MPSQEDPHPLFFCLAGELPDLKQIWGEHWFVQGFSQRGCVCEGTEVIHSVSGDFYWSQLRRVDIFNQLDPLLLVRPWYHWEGR
ncbi:hypothetical protein GCM10010833_33820 [Blastomonas aquatica]|uniref:Uncharacterized protein n=1 Tax=Blastomonas aquatica TaxID=1510276 RepID=A0ABQ1JUF5_9SPHN|nr:hypothetical protein GCM10010833_33820 [Blastomonas aquatica]